jgi:hypothetical protein
MRNRRRPDSPSWLDRGARVAFTFIILNLASVLALASVVFRMKVWRR